MNRLSHGIAVLAWILVIYQMIITQTLVQSYMENQIVHLGLVGLLLSLVNLTAARNALWKAFWMLFAVLFVAVSIYLKGNFLDLENSIGFPNAEQAVVGSLLLVLVLVCTAQAWGKVFPSIAIAALLYFFFGHYLPEPFYHSPIKFSTAISFLSLGFGTGIFGNILGMIVEFGFLLVLFGSLLEIMGANEFFLEMGKLGGKVSRGGPAQTAVVGSALVGMSSGSALANVMITGAFTIPTMKKFGYRPEVAGAIEAVASAGSQIMPPVMGATAFLMAGFLGIPFSQVMMAAIVPALLYFAAVALNVELIARKFNIQAPSGTVNMALLLERAAVFLVPLLFLSTLLVLQKSPGFTSFYSILLVLAIGFARKSTRPSLSRLFKGVTEGAVAAAKISMVVATVAIIAQVVITTGLGTKMAHFISMVSNGNLLITLIMAMFMSIILGCGVPSSAAYALVAILVAPAVVKMGIPAVQIHFFCLYFAVISCITPPVALATLGATSIAESNYNKTGWEALKLSLTGYLIPFFVVYNADILLRGTDTTATVLSISAAFMGLCAISAATYGYFIGFATAPMRLMAGASALGFCSYVFTQNIPFLMAGLTCGVAFLVWQTIANKKSCVAA